MTEPKRTRGKKILPALVAGVIVIGGLTLSDVGFAAYYHDRIIPRVMIAGTEVGGLTTADAKTRLAVAVTTLENHGFIFSDGDKTVKLEHIVSFDQESALASAAAIGHSGEWADRYSALLQSAAGTHLTLPFTLDREKLRAALKENFGDGEHPGSDATLTISVSGTSSSATVVPETEGTEYRYDAAIDALDTQLRTLQISTITLEKVTSVPAVLAAQAEAAKSLVAPALTLAPLALSAEEKHWTLTREELAGLLEVHMADGAPTLGFGHDKLVTYLGEFAATYDIKAAETSFELDPDTKKMTAFEQGRNGRHIMIDETIAQLADLLKTAVSGEKTPAALVVPTEEIKSRVISASAAELGIEEVLGIGRSNFKGSPANRVKNIRHGASKLNGVLIAPDEEFSLLTHLGPFTVEDGYLPEKVIKGDRILPEVGGGLCQIGTTTFRAVMHSGLPVLERQNHSLVVSYYNDPSNRAPGTDATIYDPSPDFKFKNDTGHWILFTTDLNATSGDLAFTLWGTPDGRKGAYTPPTVIRWLPAEEERKIIETTDLAPGQYQCTHAWKGADAVFTYTITHPDGTTTDKVFTSHYRSLPEVCAVGVGTPVDELPAPMKPGATTIVNGNVPVPIVPAPASGTSSPIDLPAEAVAGN